MTCLPVEQVAMVAAAAVGLAVMSPKDWHDIALDAARTRWGLGPGGSATEEEEEAEDPDQ